MSGALYQPVFLGVTTFACVIMFLQYISSPDYRVQKQKNTMILPVLMSVIFVFWIGLRPVSGYYFGDMSTYAGMYERMELVNVKIDLRGEWLWLFLTVTCKRLGLDVHAYFTVVEAIYILSVLWAVKRFTPTNPMLAMLFVFSSLMFFSFGTNGLRNGLGCHVMLLAISFFFDDKYIIGGLLCIAALGFHKSTMLPIAAMLAGRFVIKNFKLALLIWFGSIAVSLVVGNAVMEFFASLGFDDRMSSYNTDQYAHQFSNTGFRWDFLLYSSFPILMGWYVCVKKKIKDDWYRTLCVTYCLCNAFWIMVIRAAFSNRFAYLSWFMYPIVIAYPLINLPVWERQDKNTAMILAAYCGFTIFMQLYYWG